MPLSEDDKKEVSALVNAGIGSALGLKEGQGFGDLLSEQINGTINGYDARSKKEREALTKQISGIAETLKALQERQTEPPAQPQDPAQPAQPGALPKEAADRLAAMEKTLKEAEKRAQAAELARQEQEKLAAEQAKKQADRELRDEVRRVFGSKEVGADAERLDMLVAMLHGDPLSRGEESRIRKGERGYEMQVGRNKYTQELEWKPLEEAGKEFVKTPTGKWFLPPVPGNGVQPGPQGGQNGNRISLENLDASQFVGKNSAEILAATKDLKLG